MSDGAGWSSGAGATDQGPRARNEDAFLSAGPVHVVADGMGGHHAGAAASAAVIEVFSEIAADAVVAPERVAEAVVASQRAVLEVSRAVGGESGTTLTGAVAVEHAGAPWWMVINVGDSRTYLTHRGQAFQITRDHSHVQDLVDAGRLTPEQAEGHPDSNIITRAIGDGVPEFDSWLVPVIPGSRLVMASDGLTKVVDARRIGAIAAMGGSPLDTATQLVDAALALATNDNVTVVVADALDVTTPADATVDPWRLWGERVDEEDDTSQSSRRRARA